MCLVQSTPPSNFSHGINTSLPIFACGTSAQLEAAKRGCLQPEEGSLKVYWSSVMFLTHSESLAPDSSKGDLIHLNNDLK